MVKIETYRGCNIHFNASEDEFFCPTVRCSGSFKDVRKKIDDFLKDQETFTPFEVEQHYSYDVEITTIVGILENGMYITATGCHVSEYDCGRLILRNPDNDAVREELKKIWMEIQRLHRKYDEVQKAGIKGTLLKDYKP
jgi:hypothetical protein